MLTCYKFNYIIKQHCNKQEDNIMTGKELKYGNSIQVSKGEIHLPYLTVGEYGEDSLIVLHTRSSFPSGRQLDNKVYITSHNIVFINHKAYSAIKEAISMWDNKVDCKYALNPCTWLYTYCKLKSIDLFEQGILSL